MKNIGMKKVLVFVLYNIFTGCTFNQNNTSQSLVLKTEKESAINLERKLNSIFGEVDSLKILRSIGCSQGYFAYISPTYVLRIPSYIYNELEILKEYNQATERLSCELWVFEKDSAHLGNICTDLIDVNLPKPKRVLNSFQGRIKVYFGDKEEVWGNETCKGFIWIKEMEFIDPLHNNKKILIKDKYLWKVINLGTPG
jgi:hypothetical protein